MFRLLLKLIWSAIPLVALVLIVVWIYGLFTDLVVINPQAQTSSTVTVTDKRAVVEAIKQVNKQIFIEHYNTVDVEYTEVPQGWASLLGLEQAFVVLVRGRVPAGFDLEQVGESEIWVSRDGNRVQLTLPPPTIFADNVSLDLENSRVLAQRDSCPNFLCQDSLDAYQSDVLPEAKKLLIAYARENGILNQAAKDGRAYYEQLLYSLGFDEVRVIINGYE